MSSPRSAVFPLRVLIDPRPTVHRVLACACLFLASVSHAAVPDVSIAPGKVLVRWAPGISIPTTNAKGALTCGIASVDRVLVDAGVSSAAPVFTRDARSAHATVRPAVLERWTRLRLAPGRDPA